MNKPTKPEQMQKQLTSGILQLVAVFPFLLFLANVVNSQPLPQSDGPWATLLQNKMIWGCDDNQKPGYTVFRKTFELPGANNTSVIHIFADSRYVLWINGTEVLRGPCRFDPNAPSFDSADVTAFLKEGKNAIAVLVLSHGSNGKTMDHAPCLTVGLEIKSQTLNSQTIWTDGSWKWNNQTRFLPPVQLWAGMADRIDARLDDGDWTRADYDDRQWQNSRSVDGSLWGKLTPREIPLLAKNEMKWVPLNKNHLPVGLKAGQSYIIKANEMIQGYPVFEFEAEEGVQLQIDFGYLGDSTRVWETYGSTCFYTTRQGAQVYAPTDSYGFRYLIIKVLNGGVYSPYNVMLKQIALVDRRYPYVEAGNFSSNDLFLNDLFKRSVLTTRVNCEDGYTDCALREKVEWMGDAALIQYPLTRYLFGVKDTGQILRSDHKLMALMLRHIAQSQSDSGMFKAHHPSDRFDIHAYIEDYACLWVQALRQVYEFTRDQELLTELWVPLKKQMKWFEAHRSRNGLVYGREFTFFDNPLAYCYCNGATLNAYVYKAFVDAAWLASVVGDAPAEEEYKQVALQLKSSFNKLLWIPSKQTYSSGIFKGKQLVPTAHAAMMALNRGIVPANRKPQVEKHLLMHYNDRNGKSASNGIIPDAFFNLDQQVNGIASPYCSFWLLEELFKAGEDRSALNFIRQKWDYIRNDTLTGTLTEAFGGGDLCHNNGAIASYFLLSGVLGVSEKLPVSSKTIEIKPMLGDLDQAEGTVVTNHGPVQVRWQKQNGEMSFSIHIPAGTKAEVILPYNKSYKKLLVNGQSVPFKTDKSQLSFTTGSQVTEGIYK
jgi:alpha-L-rhamnosidase